MNQDTSKKTGRNAEVEISLELNSESCAGKETSSWKKDSPYMAVLFSAVIFPGAGQWLQKHYGRALLFGGGTLGCFGAWMAAIITRTLALSQENIQTTELADIGDITQHVFITFSETAGFMYQAVSATTIFLLPLIVIWVASVADAYHVARPPAPHSSG